MNKLSPPLDVYTGRKRWREAASSVFFPHLFQSPATGNITKGQITISLLSPPACCRARGLIIERRGDFEQSHGIHVRGLQSGDNVIPTGWWINPAMHLDVSETVLTAEPRYIRRMQSAAPAADVIYRQAS